MINMKDLIKKQGDIIRKQSGMNIKEGKVGSSYLSKFANYLEHLDQLAQALKYFALKAIPHRKKDINDSLKLIKQLYKKVNSLLKDVKDY